MACDKVTCSTDAGSNPRVSIFGTTDTETNHTDSYFVFVNLLEFSQTPKNHRQSSDSASFCVIGGVVQQVSLSGVEDSS